LSFATFIYSKTVYFAPLFLFLFVILPLIITSLVLKRLELTNNKERYKYGIIIGAVAVGMPSTIILIINSIIIYYFGGIERTSELFRANAFPLSSID